MFFFHERKQKKGKNLFLDKNLVKWVRFPYMERNRDRLVDRNINKKNYYYLHFSFISRFSFLLCTKWLIFPIFLFLKHTKLHNKIRIKTSYFSAILLFWLFEVEQVSLSWQLAFNIRTLIGSILHIESGLRLDYVK